MRRLLAVMWRAAPAQFGAWALCLVVVALSRPLELAAGRDLVNHATRPRAEIADIAPAVP